MGWGSFVSRKRRREATRSCRPDAPRRFSKYLLFDSVAQRQGAKSIQVLLDIGHSRAGPIRAEQGLASDFFQARKIFEQRLGRNAADVEINIGMAAHQEERRVHPERTAPMGQKDSHSGKVHCYVVNVHGVTELIARPWKDGRAG